MVESCKYAARARAHNVLLIFQLGVTGQELRLRTTHESHFECGISILTPPPGSELDPCL